MKKNLYVRFNQLGHHHFFDDETASFHCLSCNYSKIHANLYRDIHCDTCPNYKEEVDGSGKDITKT